MALKPHPTDPDKMVFDVSDRLLTLKQMREYGKELADQIAKEMEEKEWKTLTSAEEKALWNAAGKKPSVFAKMLTDKLKEKNHG